jgi:hypothetical protein
MYQSKKLNIAFFLVFISKFLVFCANINAQNVLSYQNSDSKLVCSPIALSANAYPNPSSATIVSRLYFQVFVAPNKFGIDNYSPFGLSIFYKDDKNNIYSIEAQGVNSSIFTNTRLSASASIILTRDLKIGVGYDRTILKFDKLSLYNNNSYRLGFSFAASSSSSLGVCSIAGDKYQSKSLSLNNLMIGYSKVFNKLFGSEIGVDLNGNGRTSFYAACKLSIDLISIRALYSSNPSLASLAAAVNISRQIKTTLYIDRYEYAGYVVCLSIGVEL